MDKDEKKINIDRAMGIVKLDEFGKRKIHKPCFTAAADSETAAELVRLAEEALASKGKVFAKKNSKKEYVCWCIVKLVDDGKEGKKKLSRYEATFCGAAAGYEDMLPEFTEDVIMVINHYMTTWDKAQEFHLGGEVLYPDPEKICGENHSAQRFLFALAIGIVFYNLFHEIYMGIIFFLLYYSIDYGARKVTKGRKSGNNDSEKA